jgi:glucose-1-phosphate adenylyltransferase
MGIYVFKYDKLVKLLGQNKEWVDFGREIIPAAIETGNVQAFMFDGYWEDIGTINAFYNANLDLTSLIPKFNFFDTDAPIYTRARYLPPSKIHNCQVSDTLVSDGCIINESRLIRSLVGLRSRIERNCHIEASYLMGADYYQSIEEMRADYTVGIPRIGIGEGTIVKRAIIDKNARIGAGVHLVNEQGIESADGPDGSYYIRDRIILVPKNAVVKDGTIV